MIFFYCNDWGLVYMNALFRIFMISIFTIALSNSVFANALDAENEAPKEWIIWLENLKREMISKGISADTIEKAYGNKTYYHKIPEVIERDKKQAEFVLTTPVYVNKLVSADRVQRARAHYKKLNEKYTSIEQEYGVPLNYLVAFWAVESNFGQNKGKYHLIDSLTNLSYKNRRSEFFKNELYHVLKIMEKTNLDSEKMMGSWAGAMGHFQFMPSTYNNYAVDYDNNGVADIWNSFDDALASAANYLSKLGWKNEEKWGERIIIPWNFDFNNVGRNISKKISEWNKLGIKTISGKKVDETQDLKASVILPDGRKGPAYLIFGNFKRIMIWNRSDNYALAIVTLADYIKNENEKWSEIKSNSFYRLNSDEVKKIQIFYNKISGKRIKEDGKLGKETRAAVKYLQNRARLPADGYPDYQLLNKIDKYNPKYGFSVPVQPAKNKKNRLITG